MSACFTDAVARNELFNMSLALTRISDRWIDKLPLPDETYMPYII